MNIEDFVDKIILDLVPQQGRLAKQRNELPCEYLKTPLPLDSSGGGIKLIAHELYTPGADADAFLQELKRHSALRIKILQFFVVPLLLALEKLV